MKSKKLITIISIAVVLTIIAVAILLIVNHKSNQKQPQLDMDELISNVVKTNPDLSEQEVRDFLYTPLTPEQQQSIKKDIEESIEKMEVQGVPLDEIPEEELENIPDNMKLRLKN